MKRFWIGAIALTFGLSLFSAANHEGLSKARIAARNFNTNTRSSVGNAFVTAYCSDSNGEFTIGTTDGSTILYGYPDEGSTSHTNFMVDGTLYTNGYVSEATTITAQSSVVQDNVIVTTFAFTGVNIVQTLTPVAGEEFGSIRIGYQAVATDGGSHQVGVLLELDTEINDNDAAPLSTNLGIVSTETQFTAPNIPLFWQAFESSSYDPSFLVAEGLLQGSDTRTPDIFWLGSWSSLNSVAWDYTPNGMGYGDSAVIYRWNPITVTATGQSFATYVGTGDATAQTGDLTLVVGAPSELLDMGGYLTPDPFAVTLIAVNTTDNAATNVSATITLPEGLTLLSGNPTQALTPSTIEPGLSGTAAWIILAPNPDTDQTYTYSISVTGQGVENNSIQMTIFVPHTVNGVSNQDNTAPAAKFTMRNYPNPFNPTTTVAFSLPKTTSLHAAIYNVDGRIVKKLFAGTMPAGEQHLTWNGTDDHGQVVGSGMYILSATSDDAKFTSTKKMILLK
jgi:hypothetical protein